MTAGPGDPSGEAGPPRKKQRRDDLQSEEDFVPYHHLTQQQAAVELGIAFSTVQKKWTAISAPLNCSAVVY